MSSGGKKGKKNKGKTLALTDFLAEGVTCSGDEKTILVSKGMSWADEVEGIDDNLGPREAIILPTAPKASRGVDLEKVPTEPPFMIRIANLPYDLDPLEINKFFRELRVAEVKLVRDGGGEGRLKGFGFVYFEDRESLITAIGMSDMTLKNRTIRINVAYGENDGAPGGNRRMGDRYERGGGRDTREGPDRTDSNWRSGSKPVLPPPPPQGDRGGFRGRDRDRTDGFERSEGAWRRGGDGGGFGGDVQTASYMRGGDRPFEGRDPRSLSNEPTKERPRLVLKPRTKAADDAAEGVEPAVAAPATAPQVSQRSSIFGGAKPVDTASILERKFHDREEPPVVPRERSEMDLEQRPVSREHDHPHSEGSEDGHPAETDRHPAREREPVPSRSKNIFGAAKPVDTATREREIWERRKAGELAKEEPHCDVERSDREVDRRYRDHEERVDRGHSDEHAHKGYPDEHGVGGREHHDEHSDRGYHDDQTDGGHHEGGHRERPEVEHHEEDHHDGSSRDHWEEVDRHSEENRNGGRGWERREAEEPRSHEGEKRGWERRPIEAERPARVIHLPRHQDEKALAEEAQPVRHPPQQRGGRWRGRGGGEAYPPRDTYRQEPDSYRREGDSFRRDPDGRDAYRREGDGGRDPYRREGDGGRDSYRREGDGGRDSYRREGDGGRDSYRREGDGGRDSYRRDGDGGRDSYRREGDGGRDSYRRDVGSYRRDGEGRREGDSYRREGDGGRDSYRRESYRREEGRRGAGPPGRRIPLPPEGSARGRGGGRNEEVCQLKKYQEVKPPNYAEQNMFSLLSVEEGAQSASDDEEGVRGSGGSPHQEFDTGSTNTTAVTGEVS